MKSAHQLSKSLTAIDGKGYGAYKSIAGSYDFDDYILHVDHVQGDPFAAPSRLRAVLAADVARVPSDLIAPLVRKDAAADFLNRQLAGELAGVSRNRGSGKSGIIRILRPRQCILER
ncbi:MAG: ATPase, partial [Gemmatimonadetes bacterium]|nr:ATPase [Gemmatimonadota bacterium]NIU05895.1 ATPase [Gammaproteobacteria bacterium]NIS02271.1 ATPase [Gemmatimonadota bacterium]NIU54320.1 ATPase [Gemmatimonadota bacterium]NIV52941.1 ATPase [Gammaproteobacteria bacterium]